MKLFVTAGEDSAGNIHPLYLGLDGDKAQKALENPPPGIVRSALFKKPDWDRRRSFPENAAKQPLPPLAPPTPNKAQLAPPAVKNK